MVGILPLGGGVLLILSDREVQMILLWFEFTTLGFFGEKTQQLFFLGSL